jgi:hypothetical protein
MKDRNSMAYGSSIDLMYGVYGVLRTVCMYITPHSLLATASGDSVQVQVGPAN